MSNQPIQVAISNYTHSEKELGDWETLDVGKGTLFFRSQREALVLKDPQTDQRRGFYVDCSGNDSVNGYLRVAFRGLDKQLGFEGQKQAGFYIRNASGIPDVQVFVSSFNGAGVDEWYEVPDNFEDRTKGFWSREGWEMVVFRDPATEEEKGWYLNTDGGTVEVTFNGFDKGISTFHCKS
ncbi:hypothetical protein D9613_004410 [Agrocybe pediades]|uniref:Uncharacterized protein n=1 Tax=Agrocybe pediades TaxID=84607 RepID=A0A8H4QK79_9AGAR|nr:hypothetical protein D9613_004410 [Agrocybe pediades]